MKTIILYYVLCILTIGCTNVPKKEDIKDEKADSILSIKIKPYGEDYTPKQLAQIQKELWKKLEELKGTPVANNVTGSSVGLNRVKVDLMRNTPEKQKEFREKVMDIPAIYFSGSSDHPVNNSVGASDTLGVCLLPEYPVYSTQTRQIKLFLYNRSGIPIHYGGGYSITYQSGQHTWRELPFPYSVTDMLYGTPNNEGKTFTAELFPDVNENSPGRYRYLHKIRIGSTRVLMMAEFRLSDDKQEWKNAEKTVIPKEIQRNYPLIEEKVYDMVEEMPQFPGGAEELTDFINRNLPKNFTKKDRVIVNFVVEKDGKIDQIAVIHSPDAESSRIAVRIVEKMPRWICGKQNGSPVRVKYTIPVRFQNAESTVR